MRSDFWSLPYDAQQAIRRGERQQRVARELAAIAQRRANADDARIKRLESAIQAMAAAIRPLAKQGEDYIWRPVERALAIADDAILDRFTASAAGRAAREAGDAHPPSPSSPSGD